MLTCILANDGTKLMPTTNIKKVRKLLNTNKADIVCHHPFTIQLNYNPTTEIRLQPVELSMDAGYQTIGISIKSKKHEFVSAEYELLNNEENLRIFRGQKVSKGRLQIRRTRYSYQPFDIVTYNNQKYKVIGIQNNGNYIKLHPNDKDIKPPIVKTDKVKPLYYSGEWVWCSTEI